MGISRLDRRRSGIGVSEPAVLLALCAVGTVIALKTAAYLSHFTH